MPEPTPALAVMPAHPTRETFLWRTRDGQILRLREMDTKHCFNSMKMIFNHLAEQHGGTPIWFEQKYSDYADRSVSRPQCLALIVCIFIAEIEARRDLPAKYHEPYAQILSQLMGTPMLAGYRALLTAGEVQHV